MCTCCTDLTMTSPDGTSGGMREGVGNSDCVDGTAGGNEKTEV